MRVKGHHRIIIDVEHTDCTGVVYHAKYLNFLESARSQKLRAMCNKHQINLQDLYRDNGFFVVRSVNINYLKPMRLGDEGDIVSHVEYVSAVRSRWHQCIVSDCKKDRFIEAVVECVFVDIHLRPSKLPKDLVACIAEETEWIG